MFCFDDANIGLEGVDGLLLTNSKTNFVAGFGLLYTQV